MAMENVLKELKYSDGVFPRKSMIEAVKNKDLIIPELLKIIQFSTEKIESLVEDDNYFAHIYAMYLLAQFRERRAYGLLIDLFSVPGELILDFTGDIVTDDLPRILASVYDGNSGLLKTLIENETANEYARTAAIMTLPTLVVVGEMTREEVINYYKELFNGKLERKFSNAWNALVSESTQLHPEELYEDIKTAFDDDLVETFFIKMGSVEEALKGSKEQAIHELKQKRRCRLIDDAISELENWTCFEQPERKKRKPKNNMRSLFKSPAPHVAKSKKIGRNKPCPCGSGKKYKKCCLNKQ